MKKSFLYPFAAAIVLLIACFSPGISGIIQAIIPQAVPTANKRGNSTAFQLASSSSSGSAGAPYCDDGSGNTTTSGCSNLATLFSSTSEAGPSNSASETSLIGSVVGSTTIPANTLANGRVLDLRAQGIFSLPAAADSLTVNVKCGSTVLASTSFTPAPGSVTNGTFRLWLMITAIGSGASGAFMTNGAIEIYGTAHSPSVAEALNTSNVSYDFTTACAMDVTATWGAAQSGESITGTNVAAWIPGGTGSGASSTSLGIKTFQSQNLSYAAGNQYPLPWDTVAWGSLSMWSAAHPTRLVAPVPGYYLATCFIESASNVSGNQYINVTLNDSFALFANQATGTFSALTALGILKMNTNDYMDCWFGNFTSSSIGFYYGGSNPASGNCSPVIANCGEYGSSAELVKVADVYQ